MESWDEVRRWRKEMRAALMARRLAAAREERARWGAAIGEALGQRLAPELRRLRLGFYWPFKGEYDARSFARGLLAEGGRLALPVVVAKGAPLVFRDWRPGAPMTLGVWNIPVPAEGEPVRPDALLVPLLGFDAEGYRLGYGGGFYDRTFAALMAGGAPKPLAIGVGFELSCLPTIYPQPHDVPMDLVVTEARFETARAGGDR